MVAHPSRLHPAGEAQQLLRFLIGFARATRRARRDVVRYAGSVDKEAALNWPRLRRWIVDLVRPTAPRPLPPVAGNNVRSVEDTLRHSPYEIGAAYNRMGQEVTRKEGVVARVVFNRDELDAIHGGTLTHNHPTPPGYRDGGSFSLADVLLAVQENLAELRAVSATYRYSMRPSGRAWPRRSSVRNSFERIEEAVTQSLRAQVQQGTLTAPEADVERYHQVWQQAAAELKLTYVREVD